MAASPSKASLPVIATVTAYNEASTVGDVVAALRACALIDRVQVVDDASTDATLQIARAAGASVISLPNRIPVGQAIMRHLDDLPAECILVWCDADLIGLRKDHIEALIHRFHNEDLSQSMSSRGLPASWPSWVRIRPVRWLWTRLFGPLSGERVMLKSDFESAIAVARRLGWMETMRGYGIVLFLNHYCHRFGSGNAITYFDDLRQRQKYEKWGRSSLSEMTGEWRQFFLAWFRIRRNARKIAALQTQKNAPSPALS